MSVITNNLLLGEDGYNISRSVRLRSSASAYFNRTQASGNNQKFTLSQWVKRGKLAATQYLFTAFNASTDGICFTGSDQLEVFFANGSTYDLITTAVYRDPSAWYHIVVSVDTTQATASNRVQLFVNNVAVAFGAGTQPPQNYTFPNINANTVAARIGTQSTGTNYLDGYLTEVNFIDGQALTPSSFGETDAATGVWKPKKYAGTYGTNGFFLNFSDNSNNTAATIGKDSSGNGNNWTPNNISVTSGVTYDSMLDVPTMWADGGNGRGNYAVLNPINLQGSVTSGTITEANLKSNPSSSSGYTNYLSSIAAPSTGYWYAEFTVSGTYQGANNNVVGILAATSKSTTALGSESFSYGYWDGDRTTGSFRNNNTTSQSPAGFQTGDVLMVALGNGNVWFGKNGTWLGTGSPNPATATSPAYSSLTGDFYIGYTAYGTSGVTYGYNSFANFGQRPFAYTPPTGFKALNTQNLPDATIKKGNAYFDATTYTGNGTSLTVTNAGSMQPDLLWIKSRSGTNSHWLVDSSRGVSNGIISNSTGAEQVLGLVTALNSNGFSVAQVSTNDTTNGSAMSLVGWQWKESVSAGFDIVTYTFSTAGTNTINHSLGVAPKMIIMKDRTTGYNWDVYHASVGYTQRLILNSTGAATSGFWAAAPTSTQFSVTNTAYNNNDLVVAYLFAEVAGYSKFGSYTGNGSTDGPFVYCGFRPRWVMLKRTDSTSNWYIFDTARDTYNVMKTELLANSSNADADNTRWVDCLSNGFKIRNDNVSQINASGGTFIYAAFAENPFKNSLAR